MITQAMKPHQDAVIRLAEIPGFGIDSAQQVIAENRAAHAAARSEGIHLPSGLPALLPRLGYLSTIWAIAYRLCRRVWKIFYEGVRYIEQGTANESQLLIHRARYLAKQLRKFSSDLRVTATAPAPW